MISLPRMSLVMMALVGGALGQLVGPSTTAPCYVVPVPDVPPTAVVTQALLTAGDTIGGYRMVGIPDGLGLFGDTSQATLLMNHELAATQGIVRAHGSIGAFVSRWTVDPATRAIAAGRDQTTSPAQVHRFDTATGTWIAGTTIWDRFCSADLSPPSALAFNGLGTQTRLFLNGEESSGQKVWAHLATGPNESESWELPHLGRAAYENLLASPYPQEATVVIGLDDAGLPASAIPSEVYIYLGHKRAVGNDVERAGLVGGTLYGLRVHAAGVVLAESDTYALGTSYYTDFGIFDLVSLGDASTLTAASQQAAAISLDIMKFQRCEDGCWDPRPGFHNDFYFATTAGAGMHSRLWHLHFFDVTKPKLGGTITALLVGNEGHVMLDNVTVDIHGRLLVQEDQGNSAAVGQTWLYDLVTHRFFPIARQNPDLFLAGSPNYLTTNEESSGIVPAFDVLGDGWYFLTCQNHAPSPDPELVQGGQLLAMYVDPELGRRLAFWFASPTGTGSLQFRHRFGGPQAQVFTGVTLNQGAFPMGAFYGIDVTTAELISQALAGVPFVTQLDTVGSWQSPLYAIGVSGFPLFAVALEDPLGPTPLASRPISYVLP